MSTLKPVETNYEKAIRLKVAQQVKAINQMAKEIVKEEIRQARIQTKKKQNKPKLLAS